MLYRACIPQFIFIKKENTIDTTIDKIEVI